jgi:hypothetical protein
MNRAYRHNLEAVSLDAPDKVALLVAPIFRLPHTDSHSTVNIHVLTSALTRALQSVMKWKNIQCCQLNIFQCSQHEQILYLNFLVFQLFCPSPVNYFLFIALGKYNLPKDGIIAKICNG